MPTNDECVFGIPQITCPSCGYALDTSGKQRGKYSKQRRREIHKEQAQVGGSYDRFSRPSDPEDTPTHGPDKTYVLVTCDNTRCEQYNKFKVLELPRIKTPAVKINLE